MKAYTLPLSDPQADLATAGGKGMSLAKLAQAGLPIPNGFHVTTAAYQEFIAANGLQAHILSMLKDMDPMQPSTFEAVSQAISQLFTNADVPTKIADAILQAYTTLPGTNPAVAVRSSATAEDLPEASFAGQQETYLNIRGADAVLEATRKCWASLWTARALAYRLRQEIIPEGVALAVVVQLLVPAKAAGILFTANPINGKRSDAMINASWGLGEAVVSGAVTVLRNLHKSTHGRLTFGSCFIEDCRIPRSYTLSTGVTSHGTRGSFHQAYSSCSRFSAAFRSRSMTRPQTSHS